MNVIDKIREDAGPEDFGIPAEYAERAQNYANWLTSRQAIAPPVAAGSLDLHKLVIEAQERAEKAEAEVRKLSLDLLAAQGEKDAALAHAKELAAMVDSFGTADGITFILDK